MDYVVRRCRFVFLIAPTVVLLAVSTVLVCLPVHADEAAANLFSEDYKQWVQEVDDGLFTYQGDEYYNSMMNNLLDESYMKDCYYHPDSRPAPMWYTPEQAVGEGYTSFYLPLAENDTVDHVLHPETRKVSTKDFADWMAAYYNRQAKAQGYYAAAPTKSERMLNVGKFEDAGRLGMTSSQIENAEKAGVKAETVINATTGAKTATQATVKESMKASAAVLEKKGFSKAEAWAGAKTVASYAGKGLMTGLRFVDTVSNLIAAEQLGVWVGNGIVHVANIDQQTECSVIRNGFAQLALGISQSCDKFKATPEQLALHEEVHLGKNSTCINDGYARTCIVGYALGKDSGWGDNDRQQGLIFVGKSVHAGISDYPRGSFMFENTSDTSRPWYIDTCVGFADNLNLPKNQCFGRVWRQSAGDSYLYVRDAPFVNSIGAFLTTGVKLENPDGTPADSFHLDLQKNTENAQICTLVEMEDGSNHIACGGKIMDAPSSTGTGTEKTFSPPDVPITPDSDTAEPSNVTNVKVFVLHEDGTRTDLGGDKFDSPSSDGYMDLWDVKANVSCFEAGEACADWATGVKDATGEDLTTKNQHTTKTDPKLDYECRWYAADGKTFKQLPIGECTVYKDSFVQKNQAQQRPYTDPATGDLTDDATIPKSMVAPKFDFGNCIRTKVATNPVSWVMRPVACALEWAFMPDPTVMTTQVTRIRERTGGAGSALETAFREHYMVFGKQQADCKGPEFSLAFQNVQIIPPSYPMSVCAGSGLEFLPKFSKAAFTALYGYACLLVLRKWFFGISGFNPDSLGKEEEGKK